MTIIPRFSNPLRSEKTTSIRCQKLVDNFGTVHHLMKNRCFQPKPHNLPKQPFHPFKKHTKPHTNSSPSSHKTWNKITSFIRVQRSQNNNQPPVSSISSKSKSTSDIVSLPPSHHQTPQKQSSNQLEQDLVTLIPSSSPDRKQPDFVPEEASPKSQPVVKLSSSQHYFISTDQTDHLIQLDHKQITHPDPNISISSFSKIAPCENSFVTTSFSKPASVNTSREESIVLPSPSSKKRHNSFFLNLLSQDNKQAQPKSVNKLDEFYSISYETIDSSSHSSSTSTSTDHISLQEQNHDHDKQQQQQNQIFKMAPPLLIVSLKRKEKDNTGSSQYSEYSFRKEKKSRRKFGAKSTMVYVTMYFACFLFYSLIFFVRRFS